MFRDHIWTDEERSRYHSTSHRGRLLRSDLFVNPPDDVVPLHCIQYAPYFISSLYSVPEGSLVIQKTESAFYLSSVTELQDLNGLWRRGKRRPAGPDPHLRLNGMSFLWKTRSLVESGELDPEDAHIWQTMQSLAFRDLESLFDRILERCGSDASAASVDMRTLRNRLPTVDSVKT